ncbi:ubiquinol-cytochrome c reductase iron-sulfur subunit [Rhodoplanes roseus]|uniref:Ubiquinol-cytochrome c reductase iron-sulfur subunit n=1 Tax=Rhodoplanes roseus TaxID=29409 RepID=A0A327L2V9_9BRAD|nr:ubiquinol-cytochrome c reductase iron-sulfur subunit [Rhodoplanes roseus]RAI44524.1 ubiquinol-cytochrome c reductase iron-sulfur subunit [Rhodoplanes roseus]
MAVIAEKTSSRRDFLYLATGAVGAAGVGAAVWPLLDQMNPDRSTIASGVPIEVNLAPIAEGQIISIFWRGKPIFIRHRTAQEIAAEEATRLSDLMDPQADADRVKAGKAQWLVVYASCTHLGCIPLGKQGDWGGWFCPCHGSQYDASGRVRHGPAELNLPIPPYAFVDDKTIRIGEA